jgi:hypothetical protein
VGLAGHTPQMVPVVRGGWSANEAPSKWVMRPFSPVIHTSPGPEPLTHQNEPVPPGESFVHCLPSWWTATAEKPLFPSGPPTAYTSSGPVPHAERSDPPSVSPS